MIREINQDIFLGDSLAKSLSNHPRQFNDIFCNMVKIGESSGTLTQLLERLALFQEKTEYLTKRLKSALTYPIIVFIIALLVASIMLTKVIPNFAEAYSEFNSELPYFTQLVINISATFSQVWPYLFVALIVFFIIVKATINHFIQAKRLIHKTMLKLPFIGNIFLKVILGRFTNILATTINAGVPILDALKSSASAVDNLYIKQSINCVREISLEVSRSTGHWQSSRYFL